MQTYLSIKDSNSIKQPVRHGEQECKSVEKGTIHTHSRQTCMAKAQKQGPDGHQEDEELEGDGEEEALAGRPTGLESVGPQHSRKEKEDQWRGHHQQPHTHAYGQGEIATDALGAVLYFFPQANDFFLGNTEL